MHYFNFLPIKYTNGNLTNISVNVYGISSFNTKFELKLWNGTFLKQIN